MVSPGFRITMNAGASSKSSGPNPNTRPRLPEVSAALLSISNLREKRLSPRRLESFRGSFLFILGDASPKTTHPL